MGPECCILHPRKGRAEAQVSILWGKVLRVFTVGGKKGQFAEQVSSHTHLAVPVHPEVLKSQREHTKMVSHVKIHVSDGPGRGSVNLLDS